MLPVIQRYLYQSSRDLHVVNLHSWFKHVYYTFRLRR